jgi:transcriptional regulator with XRE-family HTH domain
LYKPGVVEVEEERIRALRREQVLTIRELAEKAGVSKTTTSNLESRARPTPSL